MSKIKAVNAKIKIGLKCSRNITHTGCFSKKGGCICCAAAEFWTAPEDKKEKNTLIFL